MSDNNNPIDSKQLQQVLLQSERVHEGARFDLFRQTLKDTSGKPYVREFVAHPGAVVILPVMENGEVVLIRNERFVVGSELWELPAGTLEPGEEPIMTAKRELEEETGYRPSSVDPLLQFYSTPGFCNEVMHAFVARGLEYFGQKLDSGEKIEVEVHPWEAVMGMVSDGVICDAKTVATLLYYDHFRR